MKIISKAKHEWVTTYALYFAFVDDENGGYMFESDEHGNVYHLESTALESLRKCLKGEVNVVNRGVREYYHKVDENAIGLCDCGREVELYSFTNECECGRLYNLFGQHLAPRNQWSQY